MKIYKLPMLALIASICAVSCSKEEFSVQNSNAALLTTSSDAITTTLATTSSNLTIEAEDYISMLGIQIQSTINAVGGYYTGAIENNDWLEYNVNIPQTGSYKVNLRVASTNLLGRLQFRDAAGNILSTAYIPRRSSLQDFTTVSVTISLKAGAQKLRLFAKVGGWSLDWFEIVGAGGTVTPIPTPTPVPQGTYANHYLKKTGPTDIYLPTTIKTQIPNLQPGDTINIPAGTYQVIFLGSFKGDATRPVVIRNSGGQVITNNFWISYDAQYFKVMGNGTPGVTYGIKCLAGFSISRSSDFEVAYLEATGSSCGFFIKTDPISSILSTIYPNAMMKNIYLHHNYIHDTQGEGMYLGHSGSGAIQLYVPIRLQNVEVAYNTIERTGNDAIQLSNVTTGNKVHHNTITNFGTRNESSQQMGILLGGNTSGDIYDNVVKNGTGNGIQVLGYGLIKIYNNLIENTGKNGTASGVESIFCDDRITIPEVNPKQQVMITNNVIKYPQPYGAIRVGAWHNNSLAGAITGNQLLIPNAPTNWSKQHISTNATGSTIANNILILQ